MGSKPSSTIAWIPCLKLCPALSEAASELSMSGSWFSNTLMRRLALNETTTSGTRPPSTKPPRMKSEDAPDTATTRPRPSPAAAITQTSSTARSGRSARSSSRSSRRQWRRLPKARSVARKRPDNTASRSRAPFDFSFAFDWPTCGARRPRSLPAPCTDRARKPASRITRPTAKARSTVPAGVRSARGRNGRAHILLA